MSTQQRLHNSVIRWKGGCDENCAGSRVHWAWTQARDHHYATNSSDRVLCVRCNNIADSQLAPSKVKKTKTDTYDVSRRFHWAIDHTRCSGILLISRTVLFFLIFFFSPLIAYYIDDLILKLRYSCYGLYVGSLFVGCVLYADDIALLSCGCFGLQKLPLISPEKSRTEAHHT